MARQGNATGRLARWRDRVVCALAESIAEQRTLWSLRGQTDAVLHPSGLDGRRAAEPCSIARSTQARWHHGFWLAIDLPLFVVSAVLAPIPGPNVVAYYLAFRVVGHYLSRGAARIRRSGGRRGRCSPTTHLAELAALVHAPREQRADARRGDRAAAESAAAVRVLRARRGLKSACYTRESSRARNPLVRPVSRT